MPLTDSQIDRYARHLVLKEIGGQGQQKLLASRVLIVGAGGLGSPLALYLAAAGVGTIGIVDDDDVSLSNLQRQILHGAGDVGTAKTESAARAIHRLDPDIKIEPHQIRLTTDNAEDIVSRYDIIADGTDTFASRFTLHDACYRAGKTLVSGAVIRFDGQLATYKAHIREDGKQLFPCYRCLVPEAPDGAESDTCSGIGVLGAAAGVMGSLQAVEVVKEILGIGTSMAGRLLIWDFLSGTTRTLRVQPDPSCSFCGIDATEPALSPSAS